MYTKGYRYLLIVIPQFLPYYLLNQYIWNLDCVRELEKHSRWLYVIWSSTIDAYRGLRSFCCFFVPQWIVDYCFFVLTPHCLLPVNINCSLNFCSELTRGGKARHIEVSVEDLTQCLFRAQRTYQWVHHSHTCQPDYKLQETGNCNFCSLWHC